MYRTAYNPTAGPVIVDDEGRSIGGREWGTYATTEEAAQRALGTRDLIAVDRPEDSTDIDPRALAAFERTDEINARMAEARNLDKPALAEVAETAGLVPPGAEPGVADLREVVAEHTEVAIPAASPKPTRKRTSQEA